MKQTTILLMPIAFIALLLAGCSSDSTGSNIDEGAFTDLVGTWDCTSYVFTSVANSNITDDIKASQGLTYTMSIEESGAFTITISAQGIPPQTVTGQMATSASGDFETGDPGVSVSRNGNQLIFTDSDELHNFGNGNEPATLRIVYTKR